MQRRKETETEIWCGACRVMQPKSEFTRCSASPSGLQYHCRAVATERNQNAHKKAAARNNARHARQRRERKAAPDAKAWVAKRMLADARRRARQNGLEFSISLSDVEWGDICPIFGCELTYVAIGERCAVSASLDRIDPARGYTPDNVWVISWRANRIKADATLGELEIHVEGLQHRAGRLLDGYTHDDMPGSRATL